jgi:hypothetical protein
MFSIAITSNGTVYVELGNLSIPLNDLNETYTPQQGGPLQPLGAQHAARAIADQLLRALAEAITIVAAAGGPAASLSVGTFGAAPLGHRRRLLDEPGCDIIWCGASSGWRHSSPLQRAPWLCRPRGHATHPPPDCLLQTHLVSSPCILASDPSHPRLRCPCHPIAATQSATSRAVPSTTSATLTTSAPQPRGLATYVRQWQTMRPAWSSYFPTISKSCSPKPCPCRASSSSARCLAAPRATAATRSRRSASRRRVLAAPRTSPTRASTATAASPSTAPGSATSAASRASSKTPAAATARRAGASATATQTAAAARSRSAVRQPGIAFGRTPARASPAAQGAALTVRAAAAPASSTNAVRVEPSAAQAACAAQRAPSAAWT